MVRENGENAAPTQASADTSKRKPKAAPKTANPPEAKKPKQIRLPNLSKQQIEWVRPLQKDSR